ncbi:MAG: type V CRISPR-associated protein Cpf1 [Bacteroidetes bacterium HGW-Bacteroidetes-12]|nr:MAG: type V CRISPR-associated protein Cpf1 [Bacteroidetes bacterium HGW-Bacteroidetes-12]
MESPTTQLKKFTNLYQLSKTLRFELKPVGKTKEHIETKGILKKDEERAVNYKLIKKIIDGFHKHFIELAMQQVKLSKLDELAELYNASAERKKEESYKKELEQVQAALRKEIVKGFNIGEAKEIFSKIDKKELFTELLDEWVKNLEEKKLVDDFKTFTTYFTGFHENRKNMYTDKAQSTAIAYRLVHENLPKFLDNTKIFKQIETKFEASKIEEIETKLEPIIQGTSLSEIFTLDYYNHALTQAGIDFINNIIGGYTEDEGKKKIQGLNEYINLYNQKQEKKNRIPKLKILYKQILSDRDSISFLPDAFEDSQEVLNAIQNYYQTNLIDFKPKDKEETENVLEETKKLLTELFSNELSKIYIRNDKAITDISQALFNDWGVFKSALEYKFIQDLELGTKELSKKQENEKEKYLKQAYFSIAEIENALFAYQNETDVLNEIKENSHPIADYFTKHFKAKKKVDTSTSSVEKDFDLIANIDAKYSCIKGILNTDYPKDKKLNQEKKTIDDLKVFLDSLMELLHFVKPLALPNDSILEKDENFYSHFESYYEQLELLIPLYNKVRNYAAKKPYSTEKFKLNFENATLLKGWDKNKEIDNTSVILRKRGLYYLAIMPQDNKNVFKKSPNLKNNESCFEKMDYKQMALPMGFGAFVRKCFGTAFQLGWNCPKSCINEEDKIIIKEDEVKNNRAEIIDCYKDFLNIYEKDGFQYKEYGFNFKESKEYESLREFFIDVEQKGYKIEFQNISENYIHQLVNEGKLYLFQIYNKDFSSYSKGKPNMHTMYWKALFDPENLKDVVYKLNGQAEVFYRKKSIEDKNIITHKANEPIENKNPKAKKTQSTFEYDLIKDKRYTVDKFHFHVPITINFKATGNNYINQQVLDHLKNNTDVNIIGLDRGERHLIYLTLINQKGEILLQESLNTIVNKKFDIETPYHTLLQNKEDERAKARENWGVIENIKELKEGYLSQVVHKIAKLMVDYNAIVVMEDLNTGFKRGRFKVEKQVYQKLEKMLIDKLNYLVFKDKDPNEVGGLYNALQLTNKFESFSKMGKQSGFLFYVPAWNTSKIDPTTGFVNLFYAKYESIPKAQDFFTKFKSIRYNSDENYFEFAFDYNDFTTRAEGTKSDWTVCTYGDRIKTFRNPEKNNQWDNQEVNLIEQFEAFFGKHNITYGDGNCIKKQLIEQDKKEFFEELFHLFKLTLQMRNSITNSEIDYLISPVKNSKKEFYDSRKADSTLPKDADANGAYHIAKKGLMWLEKINSFKGSDWKKLDLDKTNKTWLNFVQETASEKHKKLQTV